MTRKTVTILMPGETETRAYHLEAAKAEQFAAQVRADGGKAEIGPLSLGDETAKLLGRLGIALQ
jgi:hypothetical protein